MRYFPAVLLLILLSQITTGQYCANQSKQNCPLTRGCAYVNSQCTQFAGCTAYVGTTTAICKSISSICISDGKYCINAASCAIYTSQSQCTSNSSINGQCIWSSNCREPLCTDAPTTFTTDTQCNTFLQGCLTTGQGCATTLSSCDQYQGTKATCGYYKGLDGYGYCMGQLTASSVPAACVKYQPLCEYQTLNCETDTCCRNWLPTCISSRNGCVQNPNPQTGIKVFCTQLIFSNCESTTALNKFHAQKLLPVRLKHPIGYTTDDKCQAYFNGNYSCVTNGAGCMSAPYNCQNWQVQSKCNKDSSGNPCYWINGKCQKHTKCTDLTFQTNSLCSIASDLCLTDGTQCIAHDQCINYQNKQSCIIGTDGECIWGSFCYLKNSCASKVSQSDCITGVDGNCVWASSCILKKACSSYSNQSDCVTGTDGDCTWANGACIKKELCASYNAQSKCVNGSDGTCIWQANSCMLKTCSTYPNQSDCITGVDGNCVWASSCILKKACSSYSNQSDCVTGTDGDCTQANGACIKKELCTSYNAQSKCVNGSDGTCIWQANSCMLKTCSTNVNQSDCITGVDGNCVWASSCILKKPCSSYNNQSDCVTGTDGDCTWANGACIKKELCTSYNAQSKCVNGSDGTCIWQANSCMLKTCSTYPNQSDCITGVDGNCVWASSCILKKACSSYSNQSDCVTGTDGDCTQANGACIKKELCTSYNAQSKCVNGSDGTCIWQNNTCTISKFCYEYNIESLCVIGADGHCLWNNNICYLQKNCSQYDNPQTCTTGTDGTCLWKNSVCFLQQNCSQYNQQQTCHAGIDGACFWKNDICILQQACSQYKSQQTCSTGIDGACLWRGTFCMLFQNCQSYNSEQTCQTGTDGNCVWLTTKCILKQACSNYDNSQNCINGSDGPCAWLQRDSKCKLTHCSNPIENQATCKCQNGIQYQNLGYFNYCTEQCQPQCQTCNSASDVCLTCNIGYINPPACILECSQAEPQAQFSDDLNKIIIRFQTIIQQTQTITCAGLFEKETLQNLGSDSICIISQDNKVQITLGKQATIQLNTKLVFQANYLYLGNCTTPLTKIQSPTVVLPNIILKPSITFDSNTYLATQCDDLFINIVAQSNNGQNELIYQKWSIVSADNATSIQPLILDWNRNLSLNSYIIPSKYLSGQQNIMLSLLFINFIGTQSSQSIIIMVKEKSLNYVMLPSKQIPFQTYIEILFFIKIQSCLQQERNNQEYNITIALKNQTQQIKQTQLITAGVSKTLQFPIAQLSYQPYEIILYDQQVEKLKIPFQLSLEDLKVSILGGDQSIGMNQIMNLTGTIIDPNSQIAFDQSKYQIQWFCVDPLTNSPCLKTDQNALQFSVNVTNMLAHETLQVTLKVKSQNSNKSYTSTIKLTIVEDIIIPMIMTGNQCSLNSKVNLNDKLNITVELLAPSIDMTQIKGQLAYLKDGQYQPFMQFSYMSFLVDINQLYTSSKLDNVKLQATVTLPQYKNPSTATITIMINIPPQKCQFKANPRLDQHNLQVFGCVTANQPLQYQFIQYQSAQDFDYDSNLGLIQKGVILSDFVLQSNFITYLSPSNTSLIVAVIKDSLAAQSNTSLSLAGLSNNLELNYAKMLEDEKKNIQRNIFTILNDNQQNQRNVNKSEIDLIDKMLEGGNQTDPLVLKNQILYSKIYGVNTTKLVSKMNTSKTVAISLSEKADLLQKGQVLNQINPMYQQSIRDIYQTANNLGDYMSSLFIQSQSVQGNNNTTNETNTTTNFNSQLIEGAQTLTSILTDLTSVNQGPVKITTESFVLSSQKMTALAANAYFGAEAIKNGSQVVSFSTQEFIINPYENQSSFVNPVKAPLIIPNLTDLAKKQVIPQKPVPFSFKFVSDIKVDCASKVNEKWSLGVCKLVQSTVIECLCETLSPLSLLQAAIFIVSSFKALFEREIISKINVFPYFQALFTYIIASLVMIFFIGKYLSHRKDVINSLRVGPVSICNSIEVLEYQMPDSIGLRSQKLQKKVLQTIPPLYTEQSLMGQVNNRITSKFQGFIQFLKNSHPLFSIYWLDDPEEPRILRITILFLGIFGKICIFVLFGKNLAITILIVLSICQTIYGITFSFMLSLMMKAKNAFIKKLGVFIGVSLTLIQSYMIIAALALYSSPSQANTAALTYLVSFATDYFVSNMIFELLKYSIILRTCNSTIAHKLFQKLLPVGLQELLFGKQIQNRPTAWDV